MAVQLSSFIVPKGGNTWFILEDKYLRGGLQVLANAAARDAIVPENRKASMIVITQDDNKLWQLDKDLVTWKAFSAGGGTPTRQTVKYATKSLNPNDVENFSLELGRTAVVYKLSVDTPCVVEAFETVLREDTNPYKFVATSDHLEDDGSSLMTDGTVLRGRRYTILSNQETGESMDIYFRITNNDIVAKNVNLTLSFLPIELV